MSIILSLFTEVFKKVYGIVFGASLLLSYYFVKKNSKLKENNEILTTNLEETNIESEKIITLQSKQIEIASRPPLSRDHIHEWMRKSEDTNPH